MVVVVMPHSAAPEVSGGQSLKPREKRGYQVEYDKSLSMRTTLPDLTAGVGQPWIDLDCFRALLTRTNPNNLLKTRDENFPVTNLPRLRCTNHGINHCGQVIVGTHDFDFYLGNKIDGVLSSSIHFSVAFLATKTSHFRNRHPIDSLRRKRIFDVFEFEMPDDRFNFLHSQFSDLEPLVDSH